MRDDLTDITILLDRSQSMEDLTDSTIDAINAYIASQVLLPGECNITLVQFCTELSRTYTAVPAGSVVPLTRQTYQAKGWGTALIDSMAQLIDDTAARINAIPEAQRPGRVFFVTQTDGQENQRTNARFSKDDLKTRVQIKERENNWQFVYLGANQDAIAEAAQYGIGIGKAMTYHASEEGTDLYSGSLRKMTARMRSCDASMLATVSFDQDDRAAQNNLIGSAGGIGVGGTTRHAAWTDPVVVGPSPSLLSLVPDTDDVVDPGLPVWTTTT